MQTEVINDWIMMLKGIFETVKVVIVFIAILGVFYLGLMLSYETAMAPGTGPSTIKLETAFSEGCSVLKQNHSCNPLDVGKVFTNYSIVGTERKLSLLKICEIKYQNRDMVLCAQACGCSV